MTDDDYVTPGDEGAVEAAPDMAGEWEQHFHEWWQANWGSIHKTLIKARSMIPQNADRELLAALYRRGLDGAIEHQSGIDRISDSELNREINAEALDLIIYLMEYGRRHG